MQPRTLAILITLLPFLITNLVYLVSAYEGYIPWCIPNIDGCVSISKAARNGSALFIFRATMIVYGVLLIWFWFYVRQWLRTLYNRSTTLENVILWLGIAGSLSLIIYVDFYRYLRRDQSFYAPIWYFDLFYVYSIGTNTALKTALPHFSLFV